jgi:hypothetical protein
MKVLACALVALVFALGAWAQPDPNDPPPDPMMDQGQIDPFRGMDNTFEGLPPRTAVTATGVFQLKHGLLVKYDPATMKEVGSLDLFGADAQWPDDGVFPTVDDELLVIIARARRMFPGILVADGQDVVAVLGSQFLRIDGATFKIAVETTFTDRDPLLHSLIKVANRNGDDDEMIGQLLATPPVTHDGVLYLTMNRKNVAVKMADGTTVAAGDMDPSFSIPLFPPQPVPAVPAQDPADVIHEGAHAVIVGIVARQPHDPTPIWILKDERGVAVDMTGDVAKKLVAGDHAEGARVLLAGTYHEKTGGGGEMQGKTYLVLDRPKG